VGIENALTPWSFPLELADHLRTRGFQLRPDREHFAARRRAKSDAELAGIRRAQRAADAAMGVVARDLLARVSRPGELPCEHIKQELDRVASEHDCPLEIAIVAHGPQTAIGHDLGSGPIAPGEPVARAGHVPARLRRRAARGPRAGHRGRPRAADAIPVRLATVVQRVFSSCGFVEAERQIQLASAAPRIRPRATRARAR
jgi:hypothetical protein